jgi:hypothetical protein
MFQIIDDEISKLKIHLLRSQRNQGTKEARAVAGSGDAEVEWQELTDLTRGQPFVVERVRLTASGVAVEGQFEPPQLAQLSIDDQVFVAAFIRAHGSIKELERIVGVSYPTIKSRLNRIAEHLDFVDTDPAPTGADVVDRLRRGVISAQEALAELERSR